MYTIYQVKDGDTLSSVASRFNLPVEELSNLNGVMVSAVLKAGDYIVVPNVSDNSYFSNYIVQKGDTAFKIAQEYNIDPNLLLRLNGLNETDIIYPDQKIIIPKAGVSFYVTKNNDTLNSVSNMLKASVSDIAEQNGTIYLANDQLIVYKK